ncbi:DUF4402 domain-containing protein [uncultured Salegentibacter sp.]|uniref:DUF4402 domain-containing protein n=1 Tax=uncultured Salegentibacter sp. TaxID=259320 RepID=UPI0030D7DB40
MKKITFILLALISGTAFAQSNADATATVNAEIVSPIKISSSGALDFGRIASIEESASYVTISANGGVEYGNDDLEIAGNTVTVPTFTVTAQESYSIVTAGTDLEGVDESSLTIRDVTTSLGESTSGLSATDFTVGATIDIAADQPSGEYTGNVKVTVSYE